MIPVPGDIPIHAQKINPYIPIEKIEAIKQRSDEKIRFSFKLFDRKHKAFNLGETKKSWFLSLFDALKDVSLYKWKDFMQIKKYDPHPINWEDDKVNFKFNCDPELLEQLDSVQFRIDKSHGRILGFLLGNIFYIYWLDSEHNLYDSTGYPKAKGMTPSQTCYEILLNEIEHLKEENSQLMKDLEKFTNP